MKPRRIQVLLRASAAALIGSAAAACARDDAADGPRVATGGVPTVPCETLASTVFPDATITLAEGHEAWSFTPPGGDGAPMQLRTFCRVAATLTPSADSQIQMELWLPGEWNGKFMMVGGAWSGAVSYFAMAEPLNRGYAVASTATGHEGGRGAFAFEHPDRMVDVAWRAVHETEMKGQALTAAYYGRSAS